MRRRRFAGAEVLFVIESGFEAEELRGGGFDRAISTKIRAGLETEAPRNLGRWWARLDSNQEPPHCYRGALRF